MTETPADLDVVVLGGGGHVGLPLSLAFAQAGLRVGIYDTNQATLDRIAAGEMPFMEDGADELLRTLLPTGRLAFGADGSMIGRTDQLVVVIGTPVDEFLGPSMTVFEKAVDQIAPHLRDGALVVLRSTVYPGTTGYVAQHLAERGCTADVAFCPERIAEGHALEELRTLPQIVGADDERAAERAEALFRHLADKTIRTSLEGGRAGQALHQHLALHEVRGRQPVPDDRRPGGRGLHERPARDPRGLPARGRPARSRLRRRSVPVQGHDAAGRVHGRPLPARPGRDAGQRGPARLHRVGARTPLRRAPGQDRRDPRAWPSRANRTTPGRRSATSCASSSRGPARGSWPPTRTSTTTASSRSSASLEESDILVLGAPHKAYRGLQIGGKDVVDVWGALGGGIQL